MEEKKAIKVSLGTVICIIIIILLIVALFCMWYYYNNISDKNNISATNTNISNTLTSNNVDNNLPKTDNSLNNSSNNTSKKFSNEEIKISLQNYLNLIGAREGSPEDLLVELGLMSSGTYDTRTSDNYIKTSIKYSDYKSKMLNYVTEEWFNKTFTNYYKEIDGYLYFFDGGASGMKFEVVNVAIKGAYSDSAYIGEVYDIHFDDSKELLNLEFHIENYNGKCVISYCD